MKQLTEKEILPKIKPLLITLMVAVLILCMIVLALSGIATILLVFSVILN